VDRSRRRQILSSRVSTTSAMAQGLAVLADGRRPTLIQMSGIARYGTTSGAEPYTEESLGLLVLARRLGTAVSGCR
jgi:NAD dependent epimerase/dehydratase family enzyme